MDRYERHQRTPAGGTAISRIVAVTGGSASLAVGTILCFIPGPGIPFLILGGALFAGEFRWAAKLLDRGEIRLWAAWRRLRGPRNTDSTQR